MLVYYMRATTKRKNFYYEGDDTLCTRYDGANNDTFFSLLLVPSLFFARKVKK